MKDPGTAVTVPGHCRLVGVDLSKPTCSVDGCAKPRFTRGWCAMHYSRWQRKGDLGPVEAVQARRAATCTVDGCEGQHVSLGWCKMHYTRWLRSGDVGPAEEIRSVWSDGSISYGGVHARVKKARGSAKTHTCDICRKVQAENWAYDHTDPNESIDTRDGHPYSQDIERYIPLCLPCHWRLDRPGASRDHEQSA